MRAVDIKSGYHDKLAMRRRRAFIIKISAIIFLVIALISLTLYLIFFSSYLKITNVSANQTSAIGSGEIVSAAHEYMDKSVLYIPTQRNIFFFNSDNFNKYLLSKYPMIKSINTEKKYPHNLEITISERTPVGIWCFRDDGCVYFDREMNAGMEIHREYHAQRDGVWTLLKDQDAIRRGDIVRVDLYLNVPAARNFVVVNDPLPGGLETINSDLATASSVDSAEGQFDQAGGTFWFRFGDWREFGFSRWSFYHKELRHDSARFYADWIRSGTRSPSPRPKKGTV